MVMVWQTGTIPATGTTAKLFSSTTQSAFFNINVFGSVPTPAALERMPAYHMMLDSL
jgi:hypothetical protein